MGFVFYCKILRIAESGVIFLIIARSRTFGRLRGNPKINFTSFTPIFSQKFQIFLNL
ncbi:hypothetical protein ACWIUD_11215 [Helicobacter sp. 23-1044]